MKKLKYLFLILLFISSTAYAELGGSGIFGGSSSGGTGDVATDTIWDAKGDLAVGTGANTAAKLAAGTAYQILHVATDTPGWTSTLGAMGTPLTAGFFTDLTVTNAIDGAVTGNAGTATALAANPTDCGENAVATSIDASGNLTCSYSIGTNIQAYDADLTALAGLTSSANSIPYFTGSGTAGVISSSANMVSLLESEDYATALTNLGGQASDSALTTLSSKTFSKTALTGTGGLDTIAYDDLADGDIGMVGTIAGVIYWYVFEASSSSAESSPSVIAPDDVGANTGRWLLKLYCDGSSCTVPQASTGSYQTLLEGSAGGTNFRRTSVPDALTADLNLQHPDALPAANQFQLFPEPTAGVSAYTWTTYGAFSALPISTTGTISGGTLTPVIGDADDFDNNFTGANLYGGTYIVNAAGSVILANSTVGVNFTILLEDAVATIIEPLATGTDDTIILNGTALTQGASIQSSTKGAMCVIQYRAADSWMATCNGFIVTP